MIIGANGSGKSTFLKTINGIIPKLAGQILWEDVSITSLSMMERAQKENLPILLFFHNPE